MSAFAVGTETRTCAGRWCVVAWTPPGPEPKQEKQYIATVVDFRRETPQLPKRIRIQKDLLHQGEVLMPGEYTFLHWADEEED
jgi:hypothetical protein